MSTLLRTLGLALALAGSARADASDSTLRYYLARTPWCVAGRFASEPEKVADEAGAVEYRGEFLVTEVLAGPERGPQTMLVHLPRREEAEADRLPFLKQGAECILFLRRPKTPADPWESVDPWFGVQRHGPALAAALKRLGGEPKQFALAQAKGEPGPEKPVALDPSEHAAKLSGRWVLKLPAGATYPVTLRRLDDHRFRLDKAVRFSGEYEFRDKRLVLVKASDPINLGFAWELHAPDRFTLVDQPPKAGGSYLGATLQFEEPLPEEPPAKAKDPTPAGAKKPEPKKAAAPPPPPRPALDLSAHTSRLAGRWLMTLPVGKTWDTVLRKLDATHFRLEQGVRFSGDYELRDNRLVLTQPLQPIDAGFAWEMTAEDELTLVAQPPKIGNRYLGATLKQQSVAADEPRAAVRAAPGSPNAALVPDDGAPPSRARLYVVGGIVSLVIAALALAAWLATRRRTEEEPEAAARVESAPRETTAVPCPACGKTLKVRPEHAGKKVKCPQCGEVVPIPADGPS